MRKELNRNIVNIWMVEILYRGWYELLLVNNKYISEISMIIKVLLGLSILGGL